MSSPPNTGPATSNTQNTAEPPSSARPEREPPPTPSGTPIPHSRCGTEKPSTGTAAAVQVAALAQGAGRTVPPSWDTRARADVREPWRTVARASTTPSTASSDCRARAGSSNLPKASRMTRFPGATSASAAEAAQPAASSAGRTCALMAAHARARPLLPVSLPRVRVLPRTGHFSAPVVMPVPVGRRRRADLAAVVDPDLVVIGPAG
ncbi:hypothetical protein DMB42_28765 [Nonomuraea sp. WAC 01424]|nr:hypothetical protein DMB42_28765 [Nonomuraea sp. WAC 01424]